MRLLTKSLLLFMTFLFLFGCATKQMRTLPSFEAKTFDPGMYASKVDNFLVIFDASSSLDTYDNFIVSRAIMTRMNETLPELGQTAGLRSFGHSPKLSNASTLLFYGMEKYSTQNLKTRFDKISEAGGFSPMYKAFDQAKTDLKGLSGNMAVIIISDGLALGGDARASAKNLKDLYGSSICFYPILVGNSPEGEALMKDIAAIGGCGFYSTADDVLTSSGMAAFVEKVFLDKKPAPVAAPAAPMVTMKKDSDQDGVYDEDDKCPGTPIGAKVNVVGCWVLGNVLFDTNKDVIKPAAYPLLDDVVMIFEKNPSMKVEIQGHCDNRGAAAYNMDLSLRRANSIKKYLISKGISESRLTAKGFGFTRPVGSNETEQGRSMNRRVELLPN